jgi:hypothetical protein
MSIHFAGPSVKIIRLSIQIKELSVKISQQSITLRSVPVFSTELFLKITQ